MLGALLYLRLTSLKNLLLARVKRLRQPKYLFGAIFGALYFWFFFFRRMGTIHAGSGGRRAALAAQALPIDTSETFPLLVGFATLFLFVIVVLTWVLPTAKPGLRFTEAETAFLFPAPATRRMLINFKLLGAQFSIFFTSIFFTLIFNRWGFLGGNSFTHAIGWWVILSTLNLHFAAAALTLTRLIDSGVSATRRRIVVFGGIALALVATVAWVWHDLQAPTPADMADLGPMAHYLVTILNGGVLGWLLWPFRLMLAPFLAGDVPSFLFALGPALLLMAAHYFWVLRMEVSFEEATIALAEKRTALIAQVRSGNYRIGAATAKARRGPFHLANIGRPEVAFLWKNLLSTRSYFNLRTLAVTALIILIGARWLRNVGDIGRVLQAIGVGFSAIATFYILFLGPHLARQDLRSDLPHADLLKIYPLRGWQIVLGELLTPVSILSGLMYLAVLGATAVLFTSIGRTAQVFTPSLQIASALCVALLAPALLALQLLVLNGAALVFPGWFQSARGAGGGGIEVLGQRLIFMIGNLLVLLTALLPGVLVASVTLVGVYGFSNLLNFFGHGRAEFVTVPGLLMATLAVLVILAGEVWCGIWWLGERFEKFDLSAELRP